MSTILKLVLVFSLTVGVLSVPGDAYVLNGPHLLELMTAKSGRAQGLAVSQKLFLYDSGGYESIELKETARYIFPRAFRSDVESAYASRIHLLSQNMAVTIVDGEISADSESEFDLYKDIILYNTRETLNRRLTQLGLDVTITSLGRFEKKIAYVLGVQYPDESKSQLWVDRETFRPIRWLLVRGGDVEAHELLEFRYSNWQQVEGAWYPMIVEMYERGQLVRKIVADHIRINPVLPKELFDVVRIRSQHQTRAEKSFDRDGREDMQDLDKTIEDFRKMYQ